MTTSTFTEHPPVPKVLQDALKDYPDLIVQLEERLRTVGRSPGMSREQLTDQFEAAIWMVEVTLERATAEAADRAREASSMGNPDQIKATSDSLKHLDNCFTVERRLGNSELRAFFD